MRPAIDVWRDALNAYYVNDCHQIHNTGEHLAAVAVIEADREALVRGIVAHFLSDAHTQAWDGWGCAIADEIERKYLGKDA